MQDLAKEILYQEIIQAQKDKIRCLELDLLDQALKYEQIIKDLEDEIKALS